jgi:hypothetical protein
MLCANRTSSGGGGDVVAFATDNVQGQVALDTAG